MIWLSNCLDMTHWFTTVYNQNSRKKLGANWFQEQVLSLITNSHIVFFYGKLFNINFRTRPNVQPGTAIKYCVNTTQTTCSKRMHNTVKYSIKFGHFCNCFVNMKNFNHIVCFAPLFKKQKNKAKSGFT